MAEKRGPPAVKHVRGGKKAVLHFARFSTVVK
jgi:hypothetical protein